MSVDHHVILAGVEACAVDSPVVLVVVAILHRGVGVKLDTVHRLAGFCREHHTQLVGSVGICILVIHTYDTEVESRPVAGFGGHALCGIRLVISDVDPGDLEICDMLAGDIDGDVEAAAVGVVVLLCICGIPGKAFDGSFAHEVDRGAALCVKLGEVRPAHVGLDCILHISAVYSAHGGGVDELGPSALVELLGIRGAENRPSFFILERELDIVAFKAFQVVHPVTVDLVFRAHQLHLVGVVAHQAASYVGVVFHDIAIYRGRATVHTLVEEVLLEVEIEVFVAALRLYRR